MKPPCKNCNHAESDHAGDRGHIDTLPCWHGAATGNGCDCRNYIPKENHYHGKVESYTEELC